MPNTMIKVKHKGNFRKTERFMDRNLKGLWHPILNRYAQKGLEVLKNATPKDSGKTADSWEYTIEKKSGDIFVTWLNTHENKGINIVMLIRFGHGTANGGYVYGNDFVTPAIAPILQKLADKAWEEVTR